MNNIYTLKEMNPIAYDEMVDVYEAVYGQSILDKKETLNSDDCNSFYSPIGKFRCPKGIHDDYYIPLNERFFVDYRKKRGYYDRGCVACFLKK